MKTVTKRDIIERIAGQHPEIKKIDITNAVTMFMSAIGDALVRDERVELRDFGVFTPKHRKARVARNPKTGVPVQVAATKVCGFRVGKELKKKLANSFWLAVGA